MPGLVQRPFLGAFGVHAWRCAGYARSRLVLSANSPCRTRSRCREAEEKKTLSAPLQILLEMSSRLSYRLYHVEPFGDQPGGQPRWPYAACCVLAAVCTSHVDSPAFDKLINWPLSTMRNNVISCARWFDLVFLLAALLHILVPSVMYSLREIEAHVSERLTVFLR